MKKKSLIGVAILLLLTIISANAFTDKPSLSYAERAALATAKCGGAYMGSMFLSSLGKKYIDGILDDTSELDLDLDLDDNLDTTIDDLEVELSSDDDSDDGAGTTASFMAQATRLAQQGEVDPAAAAAAAQAMGAGAEEDQEFMAQAAQFAQRAGVDPSMVATAAQAMGAGAGADQAFMTQAEAVLRARDIDPAQVAAGVGLGAGALNAGVATDLLRRMRRGDFNAAAERATRAAAGQEVPSATAGTSAATAAPAETSAEAPKPSTIQDLSNDDLIKELKRRQKGSDAELFKSVDDNFLIAELKKRFYEQSRGYSMALKFFSPGKRIGTVSGFVIGWKAGKKLANQWLARRHGVSVKTELLCRYYKINVAQYKDLIVAAQKADVQAMKKAMDVIYAQRFGAAWRTQLQDALYTFENYADFVMKKSRKSLSDHHADYMRMIELGVALDAIYYGKKPTYKNSIALARGMYLTLGFDAPEIAVNSSEFSAPSAVTLSQSVPEGITPFIQDVCRVYHVYGDEYGDVLQAAHKRDLVAMRKSLPQLFENQFGADWKEKLRKALYEYDQFASFLVTQTCEMLTDTQRELRFFVELGAALLRVYENKKPSYKYVVQDARTMYQLLGFEHLIYTEKNKQKMEMV